MFRPNYAQDAPPETICVGGAPCPVNVDFRTWIDILDLARELYPTAGTLEEARCNADIIKYEIYAFNFTQSNPCCL